MAGLRWTDDEIKFAIRRIVEEGASVEQTAADLESNFPGRGRTTNSLRCMLYSHDIRLDTLKNTRRAVVQGALGEATKRAATRLGAITEEEARRVLSARGYKVEKQTQDKMDRKVKLDKSLFEGEHMRFAVISCTQIGSKYQQLTHLRSFYQYIQELGIKLVLNAGDVVDGINVYSGHEYELFLHGEKAQADYCVEHYPRMENGGKTLMIAGNHDYSFMKEAGVDILDNIARRRDDIEYLGAYGAYPKTDLLTIYLQHGGGGGAYARSYKMQKNIEQMAPEAKPDLYFLGHYHCTCALPHYRNVAAFMIGCFQSQTPFLRRIGLYPEVGGLIVDITVNEKTRQQTLAKINWTWVPFYIPVDNDY